MDQPKNEFGGLSAKDVPISVFALNPWQPVGFPDSGRGVAEFRYTKRAGKYPGSRFARVFIKLLA
jgi:hypothetical protein